MCGYALALFYPGPALGVRASAATSARWQSFQRQLSRGIVQLSEALKGAMRQQGTVGDDPHFDRARTTASVIAAAELPATAATAIS